MRLQPQFNPCSGDGLFVNDGSTDIRLRRESRVDTAAVVHRASGKANGVQRAQLDVMHVGTSLVSSTRLILTIGGRVGAQLFAYKPFSERGTIAVSEFRITG